MHMNINEYNEYETNTMNINQAFGLCGLQNVAL